MGCRDRSRDCGPGPRKRKLTHPTRRLHRILLNLLKRIHTRRTLRPRMMRRRRRLIPRSLNPRKRIPSPKILLRPRHRINRTPISRPAQKLSAFQWRRSPGRGGGVVFLAFAHRGGERGALGGDPEFCGDRGGKGPVAGELVVCEVDGGGEGGVEGTEEVE
jgi:hypothetical protein